MEWWLQWCETGSESPPGSSGASSGALSSTVVMMSGDSNALFEAVVKFIEGRDVSHVVPAKPDAHFASVFDAGTTHANTELVIVTLVPLTAFAKQTFPRQAFACPTRSLATRRKGYISCHRNLKGMVCRHYNKHWCTSYVSRLI